MRFLFICGKYGESANGICERNLAHELIKRGDEVWVLAMTKVDISNDILIEEGVHLFGIRDPWFYRVNEKYGNCERLFYRFVFNLLRLIRSIYISLFFPNVNPIRSVKVLRLAKKIVGEYHIDIVLSAYQPYEGIYASNRLKKIFGGGTRFVNYHLDLISISVNTSSFVRHIKKLGAARAIKKELKNVDCLLLPESAAGIVSSDKISYVDFPLYIPNNQIVASDFQFSHDCINIIFIGTLDANNRNPLYALTLFEKIKQINSRDIKVHIWGIIGSNDLEIKLGEYSNVYYHGKVDNKYVPYLMSECDFLLNISNKITFRMIPSKTFQQLSAHKPIINFVAHPNDYSRMYFDQSGYVLSIYEYENHMDSDAVKIEKYITEYLTKSILFDDSLYIKSTPGYICNEIKGIEQ